ncbi:MAG: phospholipase D-like domain-containing protein [Candidatus Omnitrophota bacterium]
MNKEKLAVVLAAGIILLIIAYASADNTRAFFCPNDRCQQVITDKINAAKETIDIAMYYLTNREIIQGLVKAKERGVVIRVFLDRGHENIKNYPKSDYLLKSGIEVRSGGDTELMHNKFAVIDNKILITGSFDWAATTINWDRQNLLIIPDKDLIKRHADRFELLWKQGIKSESGIEEKEE